MSERRANLPSVRIWSVTGPALGSFTSIAPLPSTAGCPRARVLVRPHGTVSASSVAPLPLGEGSSGPRRLGPLSIGPLCSTRWIHRVPRLPAEATALASMLGSPWKAAKGQLFSGQSSEVRTVHPPNDGPGPAQMCTNVYKW